MAEYIIGLDIGTTHIRAVEVAVDSKGKLKINNIYTVSLKNPLITNGEIVKPDDMTDILKTMWKEAKFKTKTVLALATGSAYENRTVSRLNWSPDEDFKQVLPAYLRKANLPFDIDDYYVDSYTINEYYDNVTPSNPQKVRYKDIIALAVKKDFVDTYSTVLDKAGLKLMRMDILPFALIRGTEHIKNVSFDTEDIIASIEIGGDITTTVIHYKKVPLYIHTAPALGGNRITQEIVRELGIPYSEAELLKHMFSMTAEERGAASVTTFDEDGTSRTSNWDSFSDVEKQTALNIISRETGALTDHIRDILEDSVQQGYFPPNKIILSGGSAELYSLKTRVSSQFNIDTYVAHPLGDKTSKHITSEDLKEQNSLLGVLGLLTDQKNLKELH